ncbi:hypothetical protein DL766_009851 [Monosporascus sp. MC13-8B]|uniref:SNF2 N-terminal domain-containing protein n=1 Tax=Monosporascus cannonballus TaxID=155416 RepID=A0ABY0HH74_9PEZI|nr:hypothetical protein DL762_002153 [Monosporascus cannonballus]RYP13456.1 hypothetical protein DL766_009851 [Monosporascus sp. MC13-8B]
MYATYAAAFTLEEAATKKTCASATMEHRQPNLDHIVVRASYRNRSIDFTLNQFLDDDGRVAPTRISSHYDYQRIRNFMGTTTLPSLEGLALPGLILHSESSTNIGGDETNNEFEANDLDDIYDVTPRRSPKRPTLEGNITRERVGTGNVPQPGPSTDVTIAEQAGTPVHNHIRKPSTEGAERGSMYMPTAGIPNDSANSPAMKRRHTEDDQHSRAKRRKETSNSSERPRGNEIIELSSDDDDDDDDDDDESCPNEPVQGESVDGEHNGERPASSEFGGRHANRHISDDDWKRLCHLFQCPESTTKLKPPGFNIEILAYQLHAIWWMLTQQPLRGVQGGCLGDAMGLGKTAEVISTFAVFAMVKANHEEVSRFWKHGTITEGRRHLAEAQTEEDKRCPSQERSPYPTVCACVKSGDSYKIARRMPTLPTVCVVPPTAMKGWVAEYGKVIDTAHPVAGRLKLSVSHEDFKKDEQLYHGDDRVRETAGTAMQRQNADGGAQFRHSATKLYAKYNKTARMTGKEGRTKMIEMNLMGAAFVFFDEAHQYNGTRNNPTDPFRFLGKLRDNSLKEPSAFTVSASIPMSGPAHLTNIVEHILESKVLQGEKEEIGGINDVGVLADRQTDYRYLVERLDRVTDPKIRKEVEARQKNLDELEKQLVPRVLMARRPTDKSRGEQIGDGSWEIAVTPINCEMKAGAARDAFTRLTAEVRSYVYRALQERKQEWAQGGQIGPEPTEHSVEMSLFGSGGEGDNIGARLSGTPGQAWTRLTRAGVYPALARLMEAGLIEDNDLHHETINRLGAKACKTRFTKGWAEMVEVFEESKLWKYREELARESAKFDRLRIFVSDMISYRNRAPTADDPGSRDGTNIRHMIVLTGSPSSAFITYMQLAYTYKNVKVMLINAATKNDASVSDGGYGRSQIIDDINSPCDQTSPNKILVSTYAICGVALNLQRANYCVMMEPARTTDAEKQAAARVNRRGQDMKAVTVMLYDERNFPESVRLLRRANHEEMLSWKENGIPWDKFM